MVPVRLVVARLPSKEVAVMTPVTLTSFANKVSPVTVVIPANVDIPVTLSVWVSVLPKTVIPTPRVSNLRILLWYNSTPPSLINLADASLVSPATLLFTFISTLPAELPEFICKSPVSLCMILLLFVASWNISRSVLFPKNNFEPSKNSNESSSWSNLIFTPSEPRNLTSSLKFDTSVKVETPVTLKLLLIIFPLTSNKLVGLVVPIPILPLV